MIMGKDLKKETDCCPFCQRKIERRVDDTTEGIKKRLEIFQKETVPVLEYFRKKEMLVELNGEKTIEEISQEILKNMQNLM